MEKVINLRVQEKKKSRMNHRLYCMILRLGRGKMIRRKVVGDLLSRGMMIMLMSLVRESLMSFLATTGMIFRLILFNYSFISLLLLLFRISLPL